MTRRHTSDLTRRFPAIVISIVAFVAVFTAVLGAGDERYIYTFAGTGVAGGDVGDGGLATEAQLAWPNGLALGGSGSLYVTDSGNNRIRRIDAEGVITTIAGTGERGNGDSDGSVARRRQPKSLVPPGWRWINPATSTYPTRKTTEFGSSGRQAKEIPSLGSFRNLPMATLPSPIWCW